MVLIEVLVLPCLSLLLDSSRGAGALFILEAEGDGGVLPPPLPRAFLLVNDSSMEGDWGLLTLTVGCCAADQAANAALLVSVSTKLQ
jgi:hypothetical protein